MGHNQTQEQEEVIVAEAVKTDDDGNTWIRVSEIPRFMQQPDVKEQEPIYIYAVRLIGGVILGIMAFMTLPEYVEDTLVGLVLFVVASYLISEGFEGVKNKLFTRE